MVVERTKPSPTRCTHYAARSSAVPVRRGEKFNRYDGHGGLGVYLDLFEAVGLRESVDRHVGVRREAQGWTDSQVVTSLIVLNLVGGESGAFLISTQIAGGTLRTCPTRTCSRQNPAWLDAHVSLSRYFELTA